MPRNIRWDESVKENVLNLVEALLSQADSELDDLELKAAVYVEWVAENKLRVTGKKKQKIGKREKVVELGARKEDLVKLVRKASKSLKLPKQKEASASSQQEREEGLLTTGRVWLLLDGVDEMIANSGNPLSFIDNWIPGWCQQLSVVLTCRLNVWEANPHALKNFQTYRTLEFSQEKVKKFIEGCFQESNPALSIQLQQALNQPGKERIKDLIRNPLRLMLLCSTWHLRDGKLPDTKAELYQQYVEEVYRWKQDEFPTTPEEREQLNAKLKELALAAIDKEENRFCLRHKFVEGVLGDRDGSVFQLALNIGWLNRVGVDAKNPNPNQPVYAFFHPTFRRLLVESEVFFKTPDSFFLGGDHKRLFW